MADDKPSNAEQRASAILLPGQELPHPKPQVEEADADVIRVNGKLYIKATNGELYETDREKKAATGPPSDDKFIVIKQYEDDPPSITVGELSELQRLEFRARGRAGPYTTKFRQEKFFSFMRDLCAKYGFDPKATAIDTVSGKFIHLERG